MTTTKKKAPEFDLFRWIDCAMLEHRMEILKHEAEINALHKVKEALTDEAKKDGESKQ